MQAVGNATTVLIAVTDQPPPKAVQAWDFVSFLVVAESVDDQWEVYDEQMWAAFQALLSVAGHDQSEEG